MEKTKKKIDKEGQVKKKPVPLSLPAKTLKVVPVKKKGAIKVNKFNHREGSLMAFLDDLFLKGMDVFEMIKELNKVSEYKSDTAMQRMRIYKHYFRLQQKGVGVKFDLSRKFYKIIK